MSSFSVLQGYRPRIQPEPPYRTPGINPNAPDPSRYGLPQFPQVDTSIQPAPTGPAKRPVWKDILGSVLDAVALSQGMPGNYWGGITDEQDRLAKQQAEEERFRREMEMRRQVRMDKRDDYSWQHNFDNANPGPTSLQRDFEFWKRENPTGDINAFMDWYRPPVYTPWGEQSTMPRGTNTAPPPETIPQELWNSGKPVGGGASNGTVGFR